MNGFLGLISPKYLGIMIDHGWLMIESFFYALNHSNPSAGPKGDPEEEYSKMTPGEADNVRKNVKRATLLGEKIGLPLLGMMRFIARQFPYEFVEQKITPKWMMKRGKQRYPELMQVIRDKKKQGRNWLKEQCKEFVEYATGRLVWDNQKDRMVPVQVRV